MDDYEGPFQVYGNGAYFERRCPKCGRYVRPDAVVNFYGPQGDERIKPDEPNATCKRDGRVAMPFVGWIG